MLTPTPFTYKKNHTPQRHRSHTKTPHWSHTNHTTLEFTLPPPGGRKCHLEIIGQWRPSWYWSNIDHPIATDWDSIPCDVPERNQLENQAKSARPCGNKTHRIRPGSRPGSRCVFIRVTSGDLRYCSTYRLQIDRLTTPGFVVLG